MIDFSMCLEMCSENNAPFLYRRSIPKYFKSRKRGGDKFNDRILIIFNRICVLRMRPVLFTDCQFLHGVRVSPFQPRACSPGQRSSADHTGSGKMMMV